MRRIIAAMLLVATATFTALTATYAGAGPVLSDGTGSPTVACCKY